MEDPRYQCCCCHIITGLKFVAVIEFIVAVLGVLCVFMFWEGSVMPTGFCLAAFLICAIKIICPFILLYGLRYRTKFAMMLHAGSCVFVLLSVLLLSTLYILVSGGGSEDTSAGERVLSTMSFCVVVSLVAMYELFLDVRIVKLIDSEQRALNRRVRSVRRVNRRVEKELLKEQLDNANRQV